MAKPSFKTLWANYPHDEYKALFASIGWQEFAGKPGWENTCAIRMSICLARCGVSFSSPANMRALKGSITGKQIELRQDLLSLVLKKLWGDPVVIDPRKGLGKMAGKDGVLSFWNLEGYVVGGGLGGHIDLINGKIIEERAWWSWTTARRITFDIAHGDREYMNRSGSVWFWEMPA